jgi:hypothetical protein
MEAEMRKLYRETERSVCPARKFPLFDRPVVAIDLDDTLCEYDGEYHPEIIGAPRPYAIWALEVFAYNGFEVVLFTNRGNLTRIENWIAEHAPGLITYINDHPQAVRLGMNPGKPCADLFIDDRDSRWRGRPVDWIALLHDLLADGYLQSGYHRQPG